MSTSKRQRRPRGHIERRGLNRYRLWVPLGKGPGGRYQHYKETFHGTEEDAKRRLTELLHQMDAGRISAGGEVPFEAHLQEWYRDVASVETGILTHREYKRLMDKRIIPALGSITLNKLRPHSYQTLLRVAPARRPVSGQRTQNPRRHQREPELRRSDATHHEQPREPRIATQSPQAPEAPLDGGTTGHVYGRRPDQPAQSAHHDAGIHRNALGRSAGAEMAVRGLRAARHSHQRSTEALRAEPDLWTHEGPPGTRRPNGRGPLSCTPGAPGGDTADEAGARAGMEPVGRG